ncbi:hypothetical protein NDU88_006925 [Pleurodeles waltl]|uniref:Uncharacterized protein n=1 Tax=Pleurodeles waltl TaxID=8319 RepID=A0AAV7MEV3_PLEWA|nr:hypothetical protein NDU88_006925 [Pleurodeles waltl]
MLRPVSGAASAAPDAPLLRAAGPRTLHSRPRVRKQANRDPRTAPPRRPRLELARGGVQRRHLEYRGGEPRGHIAKK